MIDWSEARAAFATDGAVRLPKALGAAELDAALNAWRWSLANPAHGGEIPQAGEGRFYQDLYNPRVLDGYGAMLAASPLPEMCARLWGGGPVWFMYEQVFLKEGGETRRTPWHQDASYLPIGGRDTAVCWICFDAVARENSLEFVRGSHLGPLHNASSFKLGDDTDPLFPGADLPRLPDIEADRTRWDILSWAVEPGDVVVFDVAMLHGGAPTHPGGRRRTLTLRFFGERTLYQPKAGRTALPTTPGMAERMKPGDLFRDERFTKFWPKDGA